MFYRKKKLKRRNKMRLSLLMARTTAALTQMAETLKKVMLVEMTAVTSQHAFFKTRMQKQVATLTPNQSLIPLATTSVYNSSTGRVT